MGKRRLSGMRRALDGWMLVHALALPAQGLHRHEPRYHIFPSFCMTWGLGKPGLVDQNCLERDVSALFMRTLAVGRRPQSESIGVALDME